MPWFVVNAPWHMLQALCKHGGSLVGRSAQQAAADLVPHLQTAAHASSVGDPSLGSAAGFRFQPSKAPDALVTDIADIERRLAGGDRRGATDVAVRAELWAHALIISSHLTQADYQEVVQAFVKSSLPESSTLRALYTVFAGGNSTVRTGHLSLLAVCPQAQPYVLLALVCSPRWVREGTPPSFGTATLQRCWPTELLATQAPSCHWVTRSLRNWARCVARISAT